VLRANKLKCNAVAHLLHRNVKPTSEEKSSLFSNPSGLSKTGNLPRCGRFAVWAYTCTSRALHLACFGQSQNLGLCFVPGGADAWRCTRDGISIPPVKVTCGNVFPTSRSPPCLPTFSPRQSSPCVVTFSPSEARGKVVSRAFLKPKIRGKNCVWNELQRIARNRDCGQ